MKKALVILLGTMVLLSFSACKKEKEAPKPKEITKVKVTLDWTPNTNHTGIYVAKELGFFKEAGLDVEIIQPGQNTSDQIVANGSSEFGVSYQENVITARAKSIPLVSIAAVIQHNTSAFASLKEANITSPKDFEGKRYGSWDSPSEKAILKTIMSKAKADYNKVKVIVGATDFLATIGKDADFEWIFNGWDGIEAKRLGIELNLINLKDLDPVFDYYTPVIITSEKMIESRPEIVRSFMAAVAKGYDYCISNPGQAAGILIKHAPELNPELVRLSMDYLAKEYKADAPRWGEQKESVWQGFSSWMYNNHLIDTNIDISKAYSNEYLPK